MAGALDPEKMTWSIVAYGIPNPVFNGVSAATVQGGNIWLGNYQSDRLAYLPVPHPLGSGPWRDGCARGPRSSRAGPASPPPGSAVPPFPGARTSRRSFGPAGFLLPETP